MPEINLSNKEIDLVRTVDPEMEVYGIPVTDVKVRPWTFISARDRLMIDRPLASSHHDFGVPD
jgi:hypothetical protein